MGKLKKLAFTICCFGFGLGAGIWGVSSWTRTEQSQSPRSPVSSWELKFRALEPRIVSDMELLNDQPLFIDFARLHDASEVLKAKSIEPTDSLSWLDELAAYTHIGDPHLKLNLPKLARDRFNQLVKEQRSLDAANLYRHLAYLNWTRNTLESSRETFAMLREERAHADSPIEHISLERIEALERTTNLWSAIYRAPDLATRFRIMRPYFSPQTGACSAATEIFRDPKFDTASESVKLKVLQACSLETYSPTAASLETAATTPLSFASDGFELYDRATESGSDRKRTPATSFSF